MTSKKNMLSILVITAILVVVFFLYKKTQDNSPIVETTNVNNQPIVTQEKTFDERVKEFVENNFSKGFACRDTTKEKVFFDIATVPYWWTGEYILIFHEGVYT